MTGAPPLTRLLVKPGQEGSRLDLFLPEVAGLSRRRARALISQGVVWRNGQAVRVQSRILEVGDVIDVLADLEDIPSIPWRPEKIDLVFEDSWVVVADKRAGVLTQPSEKSRGEELALDQQLLFYLAFRDGRRPFLRTIHRLDRLTSGLVVFGHNPQAIQALDRSWRSGAVDRFYLAIVEGVPTVDQGVIDAPIGRDRGHAWRFEVDPKGKKAKTRFRVLHTEDDWAAILCRLDTGRTHQVRVHLTHMGHPVLGDRLYGTSRSDISRPLLHAWALAFPHPGDNSPLRLTAQLPDEIAARFGDDPPRDPWSLP